MLIEEVLKVMTPELHQQFRRAIELGKWPDGRLMSPDQLETCMQSVIAYEAKHLPPEERIGYIPTGAACGSDAAQDSDADAIRPLNWQ